MTHHEVFLWSLPMLSLLMAVVAYFAVDQSHGRARAGVVTFFVGMAFAVIGALMAAYLLWVEEGATIGALGGLTSIIGLGIGLSHFFMRRSTP